MELKNEGVGFAICARDVMYAYSSAYEQKAYGQVFELAFPCENSNDVDESFSKLVAKGAVPIHKPENMPWNQRTAMLLGVALIVFSSSVLKGMVMYGIEDIISVAGLSLCIAGFFMKDK